MRRVHPTVARPHTVTDDLHHALNQWRIDPRQVSGLLDEGASPDAVNPKGWTALHTASKRNQTNIIPLLVTAANLDAFGAADDKATPLMAAAAAGSTQAVDALLTAGANIRCCTTSGRTALGDALAGGHYAAALRLWGRAQGEPDGAAILAAAQEAAGPVLNPKGASSSTPLATAAKKGYHQLVPLLVTPHNLNHKSGKSQMTPLHLALQLGHTRAAAALLDAGAAVNIPDKQGLIPLAYAVHSKEPQLHVRLLHALKQQQPATPAGEAATMGLVITAAAVLSSRICDAHSAARLFAAVMTGWGSSAAIHLLEGVLKRLGHTPHYLAEVMLAGWRQVQRAQLPTHTLLDRLQRLVLDPLASSSRQQQQGPPSSQDRALRLRLPLALLLNQAAPGQEEGGQGPQATGIPGISLAPDMGSLSLGPSSSQGDPITAAALRGSILDVAALLAAIPDKKQPAVLLAAAVAAGGAGHVNLVNAVLQQFAAMDWQAASPIDVAPLGALVRAAAAPSAAPATTSAAAAGTTGSVSKSGVGAASGTQQQQQQGSSVSGGFCLYRALLDSWQAVPQMVGRELAAQVVAAVEAATAQAEEGA